MRKKQGYQEKRKLSRIIINKEVGVSIGEWAGNALLIDISLGGACFKFPQMARNELYVGNRKFAITKTVTPRHCEIVRADYSHSHPGIYVGIQWEATFKDLESIVSLGDSGELLYSSQINVPQQLEITPIIVDINDEIKKYFASHPEKLYDISPRKFEELVASILEDFGLDVELTQSSRDGGVDIYAYIRHQISNFLVLVECKKWERDRPVGLEIVQRLYGIHQTLGASKSLIVTTSYFTNPAREECRFYKNLIELKDFNNLKKWLSIYL